MLEIYELAYRLQMPVYRLLKEMPYEELLGWFEYFKRRPVGWQEDQRVALLLSAQGVKEKAERIFPSIAAIKQSSTIDENPEKRLANTLVTSGLLAKLQTVASNNGVEWGVQIDQDEIGSKQGS